jgi:hypothetical protein
LYVRHRTQIAAADWNSANATRFCRHFRFHTDFSVVCHWSLPLSCFCRDFSETLLGRTLGCAFARGWPTALVCAGTSSIVARG